MAGDRTGRERCANVSGMLSYLDPGTGSMIAAAFAGGLAGMFVFFKLYWHRFLGIFSKKHRVKAEEERAKLVTDADADVNA
jgi:hypothetical protein